MSFPWLIVGLVFQKSGLLTIRKWKFRKNGWVFQESPPEKLQYWDNIWTSFPEILRNFGYWTELDWGTDSSRTFLFQVSGRWIKLRFRQLNVFHCTWKNLFETRPSRPVENLWIERSNWLKIKFYYKTRNQKTDLFDPVQIYEVPIRTEFVTKLGELVQRKARSFSSSQVFNFPSLQRSCAS